MKSLVIFLLVAFFTWNVNAATLPCTHSWADGVTSGDSVESCVTFEDVGDPDGDSDDTDRGDDNPGDE